MTVRVTAPFIACLALALIACAGGPPPPDWKLAAKSAADQATEAMLSGDARRAASAWERARAEISRTGRLDLLARLELMQCAARTASLDFVRCERFEALRNDAAPAERAYADYLATEVTPAMIEHLPPVQQAAVRATPASAHAVLAAIDDPLARLIAAGVLMRRGVANPQVMALAADTASAQGWRRPLLAWLQALAARAESAGDAAQAAQLRRRIEIVLGGK